MKRKMAVKEILKNYKPTEKNYTANYDKVPKKSDKSSFLERLFKKDAKNYYKGKVPKSTMLGVRG